MSPRDDAFLDPESLLSNAHWVRALAYNLVRDHGAAEDLVQETWLAALGRPWPEGTPPRAWLAKVLRNLSALRARGAIRARDRELALAREVDVPSPEELATRLDTQRALVDAVRALPEPYGSTVILRYYENLEPTDIAQRLGIPAGTVRSRLKRALDMLREELNSDERGLGPQWTLALLPIMTRPAETVAPPLVGKLFHGTVGHALLALLTVGALAVGFMLTSDDEVERGSLVSDARPQRVRAPALRPALGRDSTSPTLERRRSTPPVAGDVAAAGQRVHGRVLDSAGRDVAGVGVRLVENGARRRSGEALAYSDANGRFELLVNDQDGLVVTADASYVTVLAGTYWSRLPDREQVVVVAPARRLAGLVVDESGTPLQGASLNLQVPEHFRVTFPEALDRAHSVQAFLTTDAEGRFEFDDVPAIDAAVLRVTKTGFVSVKRNLSAGSDTGMVITLTPHVIAPQALLQGEVVDAHGARIAGVAVSCGRHLTRSDRTGRFALELPDDRAALTLYAVRRDFAPFVQDLNELGDTGFVRIELAADELSIRGRVVDAAGHARSGLRIWLQDPTVIGWDHSGFAGFVETHAHSPTAFGWSFVTTDEHGAFELGGLLPRDYSLRLMDVATTAIVDHGPVAAGSDVTVRFAPPLASPLEGRLTQLDGSPLVGAEVWVQREAFVFPTLEQTRSYDEDPKAFRTEWYADTRYEFVYAKRAEQVGFGGGGEHVAEVFGAVTRTDAAGRFRIDEVPAAPGVRLAIRHESTFPLNVELERVAAGALTLALPGRRHVRVTGAVGYDSLSFSDASGEPVELRMIEGNRTRLPRRAALLEGRSEVLVVPETAAYLTLWQDEREVRREPIELSADHVQVVDF